MPSLIIAPSGLPDERQKPWALQLRYHDCCGPTEYAHICFMSDATAREVVKAGEPYFLYGKDREAAAPTNPLTQPADTPSSPSPSRVGEE